MNSEINRRCWLGIATAVVVCCVVASACVRQPAHAQEEPLPRLFCPGPMGLTRGQTSRHIFHLHDDLRVGSATCHLTVEDTRGELLVDTEFALAGERNV